MDVPSGFLTVRASAARAALTGSAGTPERIQLLVGCPVPKSAHRVLEPPDCSLHVLPTGVLLTVAQARLTVGFAELKPLMFQAVPIGPGLRSLVSATVAHVLAASADLDPHGLAHHLRGLAELVLRSALRAELDRVDALAARRREAVDYLREHLGDPTLGADRVAEALFISRRRLYQLFDDGQGVAERLKALRVERAKALLADPATAGRGIGEIARECGFVSAAHFSRVFRQSVGATPSDYRGR
ncbi:helix-turn-helix transcriptional regulator [Actinosynnema sp. NPDC020468]|uniref:helix-turn-helix transcriptional regulator n=1 Tax=Actinosynnema sp. NPDC020468 TaxID=3154488 RepID=UPI0033C0122E